MASLSRREFIQLGGKAVAFSLLPYSPSPILKYKSMTDNKYFDVIIIGGSYAGLAAAMSLGRALIKTLIIDNGSPSNRQTPHSHNFLTNDGKTPAEIATLAKRQVSNYDSVSFLNDTAINAERTLNGFKIHVAGGENFETKIEV